MFKKITKLLLAASLAFSCMVCLNFNNKEVKASEVQPRAQVINRSVNKEYEYCLHLEDEPSEYVKIYVRGTYTHNINGSSEYLTNVNIYVDTVYDWSYPYGVEDGTVAGTYEVEVIQTSYKAVNKKLQVTFTIALSSDEGYDTFIKTVTL